jgi:4-hydroxy-tetrahydrodipicolinate reductase
MKIGVSGITGKMGQNIASAVLENNIVELSSLLVRSKQNFDSRLLFGINPNLKPELVQEDIVQFVKNCDAVIDFSSPILSLEIAKECVVQQKILVCGTTGFNEDEINILQESAKNTQIIWSANMSIGINILLETVSKVARSLYDFDIEILEMHHNKKIDAPSGTALMIGNKIAAARKVSLAETGKMSRFGNNCKREPGEIGFATLRGGDVIGDHKIIFAGQGERLEFSHKASNRNIFAKGALRAVIWASNKDAGRLYSMADVLALGTSE